MTIRGRSYCQNARNIDKRSPQRQPLRRCEITRGMCRAWTIVVIASWLLLGAGPAGAAPEREPAKAAPPSEAATFRL
jgi:hypothetical protein